MDVVFESAQRLVVIDNHITIPKVSSSSDASASIDVTGSLRTAFSESLKQDKVTLFFAPLPSSKNPVTVSGQVFPTHHSILASSSSIAVNCTTKEGGMYPPPHNTLYGPTAYQRQQLEAAGRANKLPRQEFSQITHNAADVGPDRSGGTFAAKNNKPISTPLVHVDKSSVQPLSGLMDEEYCAQRMSRDPLIPCAQWQNMCRDFRNKALSGAPMRVLLSDFDKLDVYYKTTVSVLQHEIYLLDKTVNKPKICVHCGVVYRQQFNDQAHCVHHRGSPCAVESFICVSCGSSGSVHSCCQQCSNCGQGCVSSRHCSYE
eukprot:GHVQ01000305.1.p1 GENE.GHVQ01000305.1~~GHVQ01000305.1.p1  ORF type:complete len:316 (+),score=34.32 GHVQ01000305.1:228-1175(+)